MKPLDFEVERGMEKFREDLAAGKNPIVIDKAVQESYEHEVIEKMRSVKEYFDRMTWPCRPCERIYR